MANYTNNTNVGMDTTSATASDQVGGGVVGAMGAVPSSTSLDLPPAIQSLIDMPAAGVASGLATSPV